MRVLITGGAGFIGSHLTDELLRDGHEVVVLDDLSNGRASNLDHNLGKRGFRFILGSVLDKPLLTEAAWGCEIIYHLAAVVGVKAVVSNPSQGIKTNVGGTEAVLDVAYQSRCKVILASSSEVYGKSTHIPFGEEDDQVLGSTRIARWWYSLSKALDEHLAFGYASRGLPIVVLRYFNSYGPRLDPNGYGSVVARFIGQALRGDPLTVYGTGEQTRCFTYVSDTVRGTLLASQVAEAEGQVINIGSTDETPIIELAHFIVRLVGSSSPIVFVTYGEAFGDHFEDPLIRVPLTDRAQRLLGFKADVSLEGGLASTIEWLRRDLG
jgi:UDP-glucose 4-epimerase